MDGDTAVMPRQETITVPLTDGSLVRQHLHDLVPEEVFQCVGIVIRGDLDVPLLVTGSIGYNDVAVGMKDEDIAEGLGGAGAAGHGGVHT